MPAQAKTPMELPQLVRIDLSRLQRGWGHEPHSHEVHEIAYVRRGGGILLAGGREIPVGRGAIYLFLPGEPHGGCTGQAATEILWIAIRFPDATAVVRDRSPAPFFLTGATAAAVAPPLSALADLLASIPPRPRHDA